MTRNQILQATEDTFSMAFTPIEIMNQFNLPCLFAAMALDTGDLDPLENTPIDVLSDKQVFIAGQSPAFIALETWIQQQISQQATDHKQAVDVVLANKIINWLLPDANAECLPLYFEQGGFVEHAVYPKVENIARTMTDAVVTIIGAGLSGIAMAIQLKKAGVPFTILEKNSSLGGTWQQNTYPGCRVDVANLIYGYSFYSDYEWQDIYAQQQSLHDYLESCAERYDLIKHIQFSTCVSGLVWNEHCHQWDVTIVDDKDEQSVFSSKFVVSAVGQLDHAKMPDLPGIDAFKGDMFHSANWDHDVDLTNKNVSVIGTAASAIQFCPLIAEQCKSLSVFQRSPNWFHDIPHLKLPVSDLQTFVMGKVSYYREFFRCLAFYNSDQGFLNEITVQNKDGEVIDNDCIVRFRKQLMSYFENHADKNSDLFKTLVPNYQPGAKRILLDDGSWLKMLRRDNVELVTEKISHIVDDGLMTNQNTHHGADIIICATGFTASQFLKNINVQGSEGLDLENIWGKSPRAYLGMTVPKLPNLFMMFGPNTNVVVNGSTTFFAECQASYINQCINTLLNDGLDQIQCKQNVYEQYNQWIDVGNNKRAWGIDSITSWYKDSSGRVSQNWPYGCSEYWLSTKSFNKNDYDIN